MVPQFSLSQTPLHAKHAILLLKDDLNVSHTFKNSLMYTNLFPWNDGLFNPEFFLFKLHYKHKYLILRQKPVTGPNETVSLHHHFHYIWYSTS